MWQAVRPQSRSLSVHQGKGASPAAAQVGAIMEAAEFWHAERLPTPPPRLATAAEAAQWSVHLQRPSGDEFTQPIAWLPGVDLLSGRPTYVPYPIITLNMTHPPPRYFAPISTGLAGGSTVLEAQLHGLLEIFERRAFHAFLHARLRERWAMRVDPRDWPHRRVGWLLNRIGRAGCETIVWRLRGGPPCFAAVLFDLEAGPFPITPAIGCAAHVRGETALFGALAEAAQSRVGLIAGSRDDLAPADYRASWAEVRETLAGLALGASGLSPPPRSSPASGDVPASIEAAMDQLLRTAADEGAPTVIAVDLTSDIIGIPIVKMVVPGWPDSDRSGR